MKLTTGCVNVGATDAWGHKDSSRGTRLARLLVRKTSRQCECRSGNGGNETSRDR